MVRFEQIVERLVEDSLTRLFAGQLRPQEIVTRLARAVDDHARDNLAPDLFEVYLHPAEWSALLQVEPGLAQILAERVLRLAQQAGLELSCAPVVKLLPRPDLSPQSIVITASVTGRQQEQTDVIDVSDLRQAWKQGPDGSTYLIVDGQRHMPLTRPLYTLGRWLDCDVVLSDSRVSRRHAQLRWRFGRYVLYDLGSTSGTTVNGRLITEVVLEPGDVFSLGGVDIIYGRDSQDEKLFADGDTTQRWMHSNPLPDSSANLP